ncbi:MAG TPA: transcription termination factor NusA [Clostridia bacterium]|jgi:N utilization substance protein A|nr:transcription termination/antitermination protein NusA [Clostridiaceae bacterium]HOF25825.1 transcription termination factor NusA [Clostridia bacterium]HOM33732.1 transcription termination factor NusA [Clostridia bacterium]HOR88850.1 transcription termination factor NusA [Clostridia bacterium]HOT70984.1 transcription termination factor NusA [Clostridia bacterium]
MKRESVSDSRQNTDLIDAIKQIERERGIDSETLIEAIEAALASAYKKHTKTEQNIEVSLDVNTGQVKLFKIKNIVDEIEDEENDMLIDEARQYADVEVGYCLKFEEEMVPRDFGRIAAQTAKQVILQRIKDAERIKILDIYENKLKEIVYGVVRRVENDTVYLDLGNSEAIMPKKEQVPSERYGVNFKFKAFVYDVKKTSKEPKIFVSRTHPDLIKRLFEMEVPEIQSGIVEIKDIAREPGARTKIAVYSNDPNVDATGACIGHKGIRVSNVVEELRGEKIDIIEWSPNPAQYISSALSPADVSRVDVIEVVNAEGESEIKARVTVPDNQLSLAIGKEGQNARLAAKLTNWKIDIIPETELRRIIEEQLLSDDLLAKDTKPVSELDALFDHPAEKEKDEE